MICTLALTFQFQAQAQAHSHLPLIQVWKSDLGVGELRIKLLTIKGTGIAMSAAVQGKNSEPRQGLMVCWLVDGGLVGRCLSGYLHHVLLTEERTVWVSRPGLH